MLTHHVPEEPPPGSVQYVTNGRACVAQARAAAAGDADVLVLGAGPLRRCSGPASPASWNCTSSRSASDEDDGCSTTCPPSASSSS